MVIARASAPRAARAMRAALAAGALGAGLAVLAPACRPAAAPPALATGERPTTGVPRYDRFFGDVHASLLAVQEARGEEVEARGALARRLGLPEATPIDALGVRLRERTERLARDGLTLELEFTGIDDVDGLMAHPDTNAETLGDGDTAMGAEGEPTPPTATLRTPDRVPQRHELRLLQALAQAALSGATIYGNMGRERHRIERLLVDVGELEGRVDTAFAGPAERPRVRAKLAEAKQLLPELNAQAREVSAAADILISLLDEAANTAPVVSPRRRPSAARQSPAPSAASPKRAPAPPAGAAPAP